jgi:hypothetical protein
VGIARGPTTYNNKNPKKIKKSTILFLYYGHITYDSREKTLGYNTYHRKDKI